MPTGRRPTPGRPWTRPLGLALLLALVAGGCADPVGDAPDGEAAPQSPLEAEVPDPAQDALRDELDLLAELLAAVRDRLLAAARADEPGATRGAAEEAVDLLIGDPGDGPPALFPVETPERGGGTEREDQLTSTLTVANEAGSAGREVTGLLRDLVAGDLGSWQRDADGMVAWVEEVAVSQGSLEATEEAVLELPGLGTRALAWALLARDAGDPDAARTYAELGAANLDVALSALDDLDEPAS